MLSAKVKFLEAAQLKTKAIAEREVACRAMADFLSRRSAKSLAVVTFTAFCCVPLPTDWRLVVRHDTRACYFVCLSYFVRLSYFV
jgi:hypothetical protein